MIFNKYIKKNDDKPVVDVLVTPKDDRRLLSSVPDPNNVRNKIDRRWLDDKAIYESNRKLYVKNVQEGVRYICSYIVDVICINKDKSKKCLDVKVIMYQ